MVFLRVTAPSDLYAAEQGAVPSKGAEFARQLRYRIARPRNLGRWLCVPLFQGVCLFQASEFDEFISKSSAKAGPGAGLPLTDRNLIESLKGPGKFNR
jgi:hypothetical protein